MGVFFYRIERSCTSTPRNYPSQDLCICVTIAELVSNPVNFPLSNMENSFHLRIDEIYFSLCLK